MDKKKSLKDQLADIDREFELVKPYLIKARFSGFAWGFGICFVLMWFVK